MTDSLTKMGDWVRTAKAMASLGRESNSIRCPSRSTTMRAKRFVQQIVHEDVRHAPAQPGQGLKEKVVGQGPGYLDALELDRDRVRLEGADPMAR